MSHFFALHNARGSVLFDNDKLAILKIEHSAADDLSVDSVKVLSPIVANRLASMFAPRFPDVLIVGKTPYQYVLNNADVAAIDDTATLNADVELDEVLRTIKSIKGRSDTFDPRPFFQVGWFDASSFTFEGGPAGNNSEWGLNIEKETFQIECKPSAQRETTGVFFQNEFETIFVPTDDSVTYSKMIEQLRKRASLNGRIASNYLVVPCSDSHRVHVQVKSVANMKTDEMLAFFGYPKKSGTKLETLSACLQHLTKKHVRNIEDEAGPVGLLQIATWGVSEAPMNIPPVDYILCRGSHLKTVRAEVADSKHQNVFVQLSTEPTDDFAQLLYTTWEQSRTDIQMAYFEASALNTIFATIRKGLGV
jgi:hypothetical protein